MATVNRTKRILAGRQLRATFFHISAMQSLLWLEDFHDGLTSREKERLSELRKQMNEVQEEIKAMSWKIKRESL